MMASQQEQQVSWTNAHPRPPIVQAAGVWCEKCNNRLVELKRQVLRMILPEIQSFFHSGTTPNTVSINGIVSVTNCTANSHFVQNSQLASTLMYKNDLFGTNMR